MNTTRKENDSFGNSISNNSRFKFLGLTAVVFFLIPCGVNINAQNRKPIKKKSVVRMTLEPQIRTELIQNLAVCVPRQRDKLSIIILDEGSNLKLIVQTEDSSKTLIESAPLSSLEQVLTKIEKNSTVTLRSEPNLTFGVVAYSLYRVRKAVDDCVNVEASTNKSDPYVYISPEPAAATNLSVKPNPLTLLVTVKAKGSLELNSDDEGSLSDLSTIKKHLRKIFQERIDNGVLREGTNEVETTLYVKADRSLPFHQVTQLIDALKESGASPVGLIIDNLDQ